MPSTARIGAPTAVLLNPAAFVPAKPGLASQNIQIQTGGGMATIDGIVGTHDAPYPGASSLNYPDHVASKLGLVAVLAALEHRRRTGEGQLIDMAQSETAAFLLGEVYLEQPCTGRAAAA